MKTVKFHIHSKKCRTKKCKKIKQRILTPYVKRSTVIKDLDKIKLVDENEDMDKFFIDYKRRK